MTTVLTVQAPSKLEIEREIIALLDDLPVDALVAIRYFVEFMRNKTDENKMTEKNGQLKPTKMLDKASHIYPTVGVSPAQLLALAGIMPPIGGDALEDTESLYDEV